MSDIDNDPYDPDKCWYCAENPRNLKGQKFHDTETKRTIHMKCLQKEYMLNYEEADFESHLLFFKFQDLIRRVDPDFRPLRRPEKR